MKEFICCIPLALVLAYVWYQLAYGGGKRENGHEPSSYW